MPRRCLRVPVLLALAIPIGCGGDQGEVRRLFEPSVERVEELRRQTEPAARDEEPEARSFTGPESLSSADDIEAFVASCLAERPALDPAAEGGGGDLVGGYGRIYKGDKPIKLPEMPRDNYFRWVEGNPEFLDPNKISESAGSAIGIQMFETLLVPAPGNAPPLPGQAERFEVSDDGLTYTFHLREGLVWSDGTPITAETFRRSWLRGLDPETASKNAEQLWYIVGAQDYNTGKVADPERVAIEAVDDLTLRVQLVSPAAFFPDLITYIAFAPVPLHAIEAHGAQWVTRPENIVVNGPFKLTEWLPRDRMVMVRNERYWDADNVALDGSIIFSSDSEARNELLYNTGQVHWIKPLGSTRIHDWIRNGRSDLHIDEQMCTYYYALNMRRQPYDDVRVRRAINMAVDKSRLATAVLSAFQKPATGILPDMFRATVGYEPVLGDFFDAHAAQIALAEAGYPGGKGFPRLEIIFNTFEGHRQVAEFARRNLKENLGVETTISNMEWKSLLQKLHSSDFEVSRMAWCADYPDPYTFLSIFHSESQGNYSGYFNPAYDALLDRIKRETDKVGRNALICAAEKALNRDMPIVPLYFYTRAYLLRPEVRGFEPQYQDTHYLKWVSLEGEGGR